MDLRHCDGPSCKVTAPVDSPVVYATWITLDRGRRYENIGGLDSEQLMHFHNQKCLTEWAKENTRNV